jgi:hypothetical protein
VSRDDIGGKGTRQGKRKCMQRMMVLRKPQQRMRGVARQKFRDNADAVDIWSYGRGYDERFFAARERGGAARRGD